MNPISIPGVADPRAALPGAAPARDEEGAVAFDLALTLAIAAQPQPAQPPALPVAFPAGGAAAPESALPLDPDAGEAAEPLPALATSDPRAAAATAGHGLTTMVRALIAAIRNPGAAPEPRAGDANPAPPPPGHVASIVLPVEPAAAPIAAVPIAAVPIATAPIATAPIVTPRSSDRAMPAGVRIEPASPAAGFEEPAATLERAGRAGPPASDVAPEPASRRADVAVTAAPPPMRSAAAATRETPVEPTPMPRTSGFAASARPNAGAPERQPSRHEGDERQAGSGKPAETAAVQAEAAPPRAAAEAQPTLAAATPAPSRPAAPLAAHEPAPVAVETGTTTPAVRPSADQATVHFDGEGGLEGRVRIALRGQSLHATIVSPDRETAQRLQSEIGDLQRVLAERGFSDARIAIHEARPRDGAGLPADDREQRHREESNQSRRHDDPRDTAGERSRRRPPQDRKPER